MNHRARKRDLGRRRNRHGNSLGITLLELLLALALSSIVIAVVGTAIHMNVRAFDSRRTQVEEAQLARAILRMIGDDLRNAVMYKPVDFSKLEQQAATLASNAASSAASAASGVSSPGASTNPGTGGSSNNQNNSTNKTSSGSAGGTGAATGGNTNSASQTNNNSNTTGSGTSQSASSSSNSNQSTTTEETESTVTKPGLFGTQYELQVDISRLPRLDEYGGAAGFVGSSQDIPSDVKTVTYALRMPTTTAGPQAVSSSGVSMAFDGTAPGLVRRASDRAVQRQMLETGNTSSLPADTGNLVAPEVMSIEFRYFNGTEWLTEWDSDQLGGLPIAVEILLLIQTSSTNNSTAATATPSAGLAGNAGAQSNSRLYRSVVRLPVALPTDTTTTTTTTEDASATSSTSTTQGTGS